MLVKQLPAFSYHFGLKPSDFDDMTWDETDAYIRALDQLNREATNG